MRPPGNILARSSPSLVEDHSNLLVWQPFSRIHSISGADKRVPLAKGTWPPQHPFLCENFPPGLIQMLLLLELLLMLLLLLLYVFHHVHIGGREAPPL